MCLQDLWIARHTTSRVAGNLGADLALPGNPNRIALVFSLASAVIIQGENGQVWHQYRNPFRARSYDLSETNNAVPTGNTGTITANFTPQDESPLVVHLRDYGDLIQEGMTILANSSGVIVWELQADAELAAALDAMGWRKFPGVQ